LAHRIPIRIKNPKTGTQYARNAAMSIMRVLHSGYQIGIVYGAMSVKMRTEIIKITRGFLNHRNGRSDKPNYKKMYL
jgi:hypothetical protein